jgi:RNA polymerase sigma factor (sigma-70 family)
MGPSPSGSSTRPSLLLRLRNPQDAESWAAFVDLYGPLVFGHCRKRGLQHQDAEDVTQKVFAQVAKSIRGFQYDPAVGRFRDWLGTIVRNAVNRFFSQANRHPGGAGSDVWDGVEARGDDSSWNEDFTNHVLQEAMKRVRPHFEDETWRGFESVWLENRAAAEVAEQLGRSVEWVYSAKSRVLDRLWDEVRELAEESPSFANR